MKNESNTIMKLAKQHPLIMGTFILTATGLISRLIGFFYRIYLSRLFGEEGMGVYQLVSPILSLSFALTAAGFQTSISKLVAEDAATKKHPSLKPMVAGFCISLPLSLLCNVFIYFFARPIAVHLLHEPRTAPMLQILAFSIPLSAIHACINGYFYGIKRAEVPASGQLFEQLVRVGSVYFLSTYYLSMGRPLTIGIAILGLLIGELLSLLSAIPPLFPYLRDALRPTTGLYASLMSMVLPLTANRLVLNLLQSIESVSIPEKLKSYGYDTTTALSVYGVFTGMALPLIFFPNALTGSVSVLLLPIISEKYALGDIKAVKSAILRTVKYCGLMGVGCMILFVLGGKWLGNTLFHSPLAGYFITTLGFICPFLYLDVTLSSILQGLGKATSIFVMNITCLLIRLSFVLFVVPLHGITGYLWGLLASQLCLGCLYLSSLHNFLKRHSP